MKNTKIIRHWSSHSQPIATADILINRLQSGWKLQGIAGNTTYSYGGGRTVKVYHFLLENNGEVIEMPVRANPMVQRVISDYNLQAATR
ncbi:MAG: hypothetical protein H6673_14105 [Anaerolineales bacterium]|nr:hypothetical protein [Anaerolineales bacterium]